VRRRNDQVDDTFTKEQTMTELTAGRGKKYVRRDWRKLLSSRKGAALVGIACLVVAGGIVMAAMAGYRSSVNTSGTPAVVLVAAKPIPRNTPATVLSTQGMFKSAQVPTDQLASGAIVDAAALHGEVAAKDIYPGEQLTTADFTTNSSLPAQLAPSQRAMTVNVDTAHGMIGTIQNGDHVDVYAGLNEQGATGQSQPILTLLLPDIEVLKAPGQSANGLGSSSSNNNDVTLAVNTGQAGELAYAADNGKLWLVLRPADASATAPPSMITVQSLLLGTKPIPTGGK
jgi:pilus assembly protein CpaB